MFPFIIKEFAKTWFIKLSLASALILLSILIAVLTKAPPYTGQLEIATIASWVYIWPPARLFEFVLGMTAALFWSKYNHLLTGRLVCTSLELFIVTLVLYGSVNIPLYFNSLTGGHLFSEALQSWINVSSPAILFALLLFIFACGRGYVSQILSMKFFVLLGEISFSLYLIHQPIERFLEGYGHHFLGGSMWLQYLLYWGVILSGSYLMWKIVEKPFQKKLVNIYSLKKLPIAQFN